MPEMRRTPPLFQERQGSPPRSRAMSFAPVLLLRKENLGLFSAKKKSAQHPPLKYPPSIRPVLYPPLPPKRGVEDIRYLPSVPPPPSSPLTEGNPGPGSGREAGGARLGWLLPLVGPAPGEGLSVGPRVSGAGGVRGNRSREGGGSGRPMKEEEGGQVTTSGKVQPQPLSLCQSATQLSMPARLRGKG